MRALGILWERKPKKFLVHVAKEIEWVLARIVIRTFQLIEKFVEE